MRNNKKIILFIVLILTFIIIYILYNTFNSDWTLNYTNISSWELINGNINSVWWGEWLMKSTDIDLQLWEE